MKLGLKLYCSCKQSVPHLIVVILLMYTPVGRHHSQSNLFIFKFADRDIELMRGRACHLGGRFLYSEQHRIGDCYTEVLLLQALLHTVMIQIKVIIDNQLISSAIGSS